MIDKVALNKMMDALMLRYWGIFSIDDIYIKSIKAANYFDVPNSILNTEKADCCAGNDRTVLAIAVPYALEGDLQPIHNNQAKVEAFGWDFDYHVQIKEILKQVKSGLESLCGHTLENVTICVDTSPYSDREVGFYAGLGRVGYNHLLIHEHLGSNFFIGYLVVHQKLSIEPTLLIRPEDLPKDIVHPYCKTCGRCTRACPSSVCGLKTVDMRLCLSAQTQSKDMIDESMRHAMHNRLYGCSICQIVCPLNHNVTAHQLLTLKTSNWLDALILLEMTNKDFKKLYGHMGFTWRPLWIYKRNALIVLGNVGDQVAYDGLLSLPHIQEDERLAEYYRWALNRLKNRSDEQFETFV